MTRIVDPEPDLLASIRRVLGPTPADQERVRIGLTSRLATGTLTTDQGLRLDPPPHGTGGLSLGVQGLGKQLVLASVIGATGFGTGYLVGRPGPKPTAPPPAHTAPTPTHAAPEVAAPNPVATVESPKEAPRERKARPHSATQPRPSSSTMLSEEAEALKRVGAALRNGYPLRAQQLLDELDESIPRSGLGEERAAARLMVECLLPVADSELKAARWLERHPHSVYAPRVRATCTPEGEGQDKANGENSDQESPR